jgi:hypothetical protein
MIESSSSGFWTGISQKIIAEPFLGWGMLLFTLAVLHSFFAPAIHSFAGKWKKAHPFWGRACDLFGEVEFVFILWAVPLFAILSLYKGFDGAVKYMGESVSYREALFVMVIIALAATRPILYLAEQTIGFFAKLLGRGVRGWWYSLLIIGPLLGSLITEPAAITITALLLAQKFYKAKPSASFSYATIALLFVNISIGGMLTHFAAPAVVMVADRWDLNTQYMLTNFGVKVCCAVFINVSLIGFLFRKELKSMQLPAVASSAKIPAWVITVHVLFLIWAILTAHYAPLFFFGLLAALWFVSITSEYQDAVRLFDALKVGVFLAGLVIFCTLQEWWIAPLLQTLLPHEMFGWAMLLACFNDNAAVTYLASLSPNLTEAAKYAALAGAVATGGLTIIANAPNPAGFSVLRKFFKGEVLNPVTLLIAALLPTIIVALIFFI